MHEYDITLKLLFRKPARVLLRDNVELPALELDARPHGAHS